MSDSIGNGKCEHNSDEFREDTKHRVCYIYAVSSAVGVRKIPQKIKEEVKEEVNIRYRKL